MFKPTKKQHLVNKAYSDKNGGGSGIFRLDEHWDHDIKYFIGSNIDYIVDNLPVAILINSTGVVYLHTYSPCSYGSMDGNNGITIYPHDNLITDGNIYNYNGESGNYELKLNESPK